MARPEVALEVVELSDRWRALDEHRASWLASLRPEAVAQEVRFQNFKGQEYATPLWQLGQHVANHSTYHRGQAITLLRQLGSKGVATDLVAWDRERLNLE